MTNAESEPIREFQGEYRWLSNFWPVEIEFDGHVYASVEHAYQAAKTLDEELRKWIREQCKYPGSAKRFMKNAEADDLRGDFDKIKIQVMRDLLEKKFAPGSDLTQKLIDTYPRELQEGNHWGDSWWGIDVRTGFGDNNLGKLLMHIRYKRAVEAGVVEPERRPAEGDDE